MHRRASPERLQLTDRTLSHLQRPERGRIWIYDAEPGGLAAQVTAAGAVILYAIRNHDGRRDRVRLGGWPALSVNAGRLAAMSVQAKLAAGIDLRAERTAARAVQAQARVEAQRQRLPTWCMIWDAYEAERGAALRPRTRETYRLRWDTCLRPTVGAQRIDVLDVPTAQALHATIGRERGNVTANRMVQLGRLLWRYAAQRHVLAGINPWTRVKLHAEHPRQRTLTADETARIFTETASENGTMRDALRLLLLTGARIGNVATANWSDIDLASATWTVPAWRAKGKRAIALPLTPVVLAMLMERKGSASGEAVFPGHRRQHISISGLRCAWRSCCARAGVKGATPHDARRGIASTMIAAGVSLPLVSRLLGHSGTAITESRYVRLTAETVRGPVEQFARTVFNFITPPAITPAQPPTESAMELSCPS